MIFYFKEAIRNLRFAGLTSIITFLSLLFASLFICASFIFAGFSDDLQENLKKNVTASFYLRDSLPVSEINDLIAKIQKFEGVKSVNFISKEEAEKDFVKQTGEDFKKVLTFNPLPASMLVTLDPANYEMKILENTVKSVSALDGVESHEFRSQLLNEMMLVVARIKIITFVVTAIFLFVAVYLAYTSIRSAFAARKEDINTMKLVGGSLREIKLPAYLSTLILSSFCALITLLVYNFIVNLGLEFLEISIAGSDRTTGTLLSFFSAPLIAILGTYFASFSVKIELNS